MINSTNNLLNIGGNTSSFPSDEINHIKSQYQDGKEERDIFIAHIKKRIRTLDTAKYGKDYCEYLRYLKITQDKLECCRANIFQVKGKIFLSPHCSKKYLCLPCSMKNNGSSPSIIMENKIRNTFNYDTHSHTRLTFTLPNTTNPNEMLLFLKWVKKIKEKRKSAKTKLKKCSDLSKLSPIYTTLINIELFIYSYEFTPTNKSNSSSPYSHNESIGNVFYSKDVFFNHHIHITLIHKNNIKVSDEIIKSWNTFCEKETNHTYKCSTDKQNVEKEKLGIYGCHLNTLSLDYILNNPTQKLYDKCDFNNEGHLDLLLMSQYWLDKFARKEQNQINKTNRKKKKHDSNHNLQEKRGNYQGTTSGYFWTILNITKDNAYGNVNSTSSKATPQYIGKTKDITE